MPVISKEKIFIELDNRKKEEFLKVIKCDSNGVFSIAHHPRIAAILEEKEAEGTSKKDVIKSWAEGYQKYRKTLTVKKEKFICIEFKANLEIEGKQNRNDITFEPWPTIGIKYDLLFLVGGEWYEVDFGWPDDETDYKDKSRKVESIGSKKWGGPDEQDAVIPWTKEREEFFESVVVGMNTMGIKILDFLNNCNKNGKFVDKHLGKNLLGTGEKS